MPDREQNSLGQHANAARTHRLVGYLFIAIAALLLLFARSASIGNIVFVLMFNGALALGNLQIAAAARRRLPWARIASVIMAVLLMLIGCAFLFGGPRIDEAQGDAGAAYAQMTLEIFGVVVAIAGIYILLNSNWQQPVPPDERPDSSTRP